MRSLTGHRHPAERAAGANAPEPDPILMGMVAAAPAGGPRRRVGAAIVAVLAVMLGGGLLLAARTSEDRAVEVGTGFTAVTTAPVAATAITSAVDVGVVEPMGLDVGYCDDVAPDRPAATPVETGAGCGPVGYVVDTEAWATCLAVHGVVLTDSPNSGETAVPVEIIRAASAACRAERPPEMAPSNDYERCIEDLGLFAMPLMVLGVPQAEALLPCADIAPLNVPDGTDGWFRCLRANGLPLAGAPVAFGLDGEAALLAMVACRAQAPPPTGNPYQDCLTEHGIFAGLALQVRWPPAAMEQATQACRPHLEASGVPMGLVRWHECLSAHGAHRDPGDLEPLPVAVARAALVACEDQDPARGARWPAELVAYERCMEDHDVVTRFPGPVANGDAAAARQACVALLSSPGG